MSPKSIQKAASDAGMAIDAQMRLNRACSPGNESWGNEGVGGSVYKSFNSYDKALDAYSQYCSNKKLGEDGSGMFDVEEISKQETKGTNMNA
ncbi:hypothetical protein GH714_014093 [Hevea brasiliensis]|nr:hypothetical protein GH714_014093 [Hevea brasiliensis]